VIDQTENPVPATNVEMADRQQGEGTVAMADTGKVVLLSVVAASLMVGAVQLASGHDLTGGLMSTASTSNSVNRTAKADRVQALPATGRTKTVTLSFSQFADTSFLLRVPAAPAAVADQGNSNAAPAPASQVTIKTEGIKRDNASTGKRPVACEPSVSILTEIAKTLQPGRCVT
jgi:hypothetical protein